MLIAALWSMPATAILCPSFPFAPGDPRCTEDGFCVRLDRSVAVRAEEVNDSELLFEGSGVSATPVVFETSAAKMIALNHRAEIDITGTAIPGLVGFAARAEAEAPEELQHSASTSYHGVAAMRATDLVFSGPSPTVFATLHLMFEADQTFFVAGGDEFTRVGAHSARISGAICGATEYVSFDGNNHVSYDRNGTPNRSGAGLLAESPMMGVEEFAIGPFEVPTGEPLQLELWMSGGTGAVAGGNMLGIGSFTLSLLDGGRAVFTLPAGYTANSTEAGIVMNAVPEPGGGLSSVVGLSVLALSARLRRR